MIYSYLIWLILSGIFYLISGLFLSDAKFKRMFEFVGYGFLPTIFSAIIGLVDMYYILPSMDFSIKDPTLIEESMKQMFANPLFQFSQATGILFTLLSGIIWIFAVKNASSISTRNALIVVGIPVGLYILYQIYNLISLYG